jgi:hypothetical protein
MAAVIESDPLAPLASMALIHLLAVAGLAIANSRRRPGKDGGQIRFEADLNQKWL